MKTLEMDLMFIEDNFPSILETNLINKSNPNLSNINFYFDSIKTKNEKFKIHLFIKEQPSKISLILNYLNNLNNTN